MKVKLAWTFAIALAIASSANAAFLVQVDTDGADDGPYTASPNFSFGGDTTTASTSIRSVAPLLPEGDSLYGGDGAVQPDTYVYSYDPSVDADNLSVAGTLLGVDLMGNDVTGGNLVGGPSGTYAVYAAWPATSNVTGGPTAYAADAVSDSFSITLDQNSANDPDGDDFGDVWVLLGTVNYDGINPITVSQSITVSNTFTSMRASAVMFERVPEPSSMVLLGLLAGGLAVAVRRRG